MAGNNLVLVVVGQSHAFFCFALNTFKLPSKCSAGQQKRNGSHCFVSTVTSLQKFLFCLTTSHSFSLLSLSNLQFFFTITHDRARNMTFCFDEPEISKKMTFENTCLKNSSEVGINDQIIKGKQSNLVMTNSSGQKDSFIDDPLDQRFLTLFVVGTL